MKQGWPLVRLGEVLNQASRPEYLDPLQEYTTLHVDGMDKVYLQKTN